MPGRSPKTKHVIEHWDVGHVLRIKESDEAPEPDDFSVLESLLASPLALRWELASAPELYWELG
jgi:hypothetical protein